MAKGHTKRKSKPDPLSLTATQADTVSRLIAVQTERGMGAFVVAGAEVLQSQYGFTEEQAAAWASETVKAGAKYLRTLASDTAGYKARREDRQ